MEMVKSAAGMHQALHKIYVQFEKEFIESLMIAGLNLYREMPLVTPKDTGWASQHWSISLTPNESISVTVDNLSAFKIGDSIYVFNNVPYIKRLDEGWSKQRPRGFTNLAMDRVTITLEQLLQRLSKEGKG